MIKSQHLNFRRTAAVGLIWLKTSSLWQVLTSKFRNWLYIFFLYKAINCLGRRTTTDLERLSSHEQCNSEKMYDYTNIIFWQTSHGLLSWPIRWENNSPADRRGENSTVLSKYSETWVLFVTAIYLYRRVSHGVLVPLQNCTVFRQVPIVFPYLFITFLRHEHSPQRKFLQV